MNGVEEEDQSLSEDDVACSGEGFYIHESDGRVIDGANDGPAPAVTSYGQGASTDRKAEKGAKTEGSCK